MSGVAFPPDAKADFASPLNNQNGLEIPGRHPQLNRKTTNFMTHHPGRDKRMDALPNSFNSVSARTEHGNVSELYYGTCSKYQ